VVNDDKPKRERTRCEVYSRVVGFLTPISQWNKGKQEEWKDRKTYKVGGDSK
jgi:ribonucleoside-triphosphate reductase